MSLIRRHTRARRTTELFRDVSLRHPAPCPSRRTSLCPDTILKDVESTNLRETQDAIPSISGPACGDVPRTDVMRIRHGTFLSADNLVNSKV